MIDQLKDTYADTWEKAANDCRYVAELLQKKFKQVIVKPGYGAFSEKRLDEDHEKGSADIFIIDHGKIICAVEVTGSDKVTMEKGKMIWLRPDKIRYMESKKNNFPVFAWLRYPNVDCVLTLPVIQKHNKGILNTQPRGLPERFVEIPFEVSLKTEIVDAYISKMIGIKHNGYCYPIDCIPHEKYTILGDKNE